MLIILFIIFSSSLLSAYDLNSSLIEKDAEYNLKDMYSKDQKDMIYQRTKMSADNSINDSSYIIGSGDEFFVSVKGSMFYYGTINSNGDLFVPEIGIIQIGKNFLIDAKKEIKNYFKNNFKKEAYVSLSKVKNSTVYIRGPVKNPGTVNLPGNYRLLDAIIHSNDGELPSLSEIDLRQIECIQSDDIKQYDLLKYLYKGDDSQNPYIYPGDEISVSYPKQKVFISGEIDSISGLIPLLQGEDICEFLDGLHLRTSADSTKIIVQRINSLDGSRKVTTINYKQREPYSLQDRDMITVARKENYPEVFTASVTGEVVRPGAYPIYKDVVTAKELITQAGGPSQHGDMNRAVILRNNKRISENLVTQEVRPEINSAMTSLVSKADHTVLYLRNGHEIYLQSNDQIYIPPIEHYVYVSGSVKDPGGVSFEPGKNISHYINKAGGFQKRADKKNTFVMVNYNGTVVSKETNEIEPGDIIVVPLSIENKRFSNIVVPLISVISTTLVVLLSLYNTINSK